MHSRINTATLDLEVAGPGIVRSRLRDVVSPGPTLLVFLRHFG
jgi:hypothetical protein